MRREDLLVRNNSRFNKAPSPSTISAGQSAHGPAAHPMVNERVQHLSHPHSGEVYAHRNSATWEQNSHAVKGPTVNESLQPADPRDNKPFWQGLLAHCKRMLGMEE